jgi:hypothetical protein
VSCARDGPRCRKPAGFDLASEIDLMMPLISDDGSHSSSYGLQTLLPYVQREISFGASAEAKIQGGRR